MEYITTKFSDYEIERREQWTIGNQQDVIKYHLWGTNGPKTVERRICKMNNDLRKTYMDKGLDVWVDGVVWTGIKQHNIRMNWASTKIDKKYGTDRPYTCPDGSYAKMVFPKGMIVKPFVIT